VFGNWRGVGALQPAGHLADLEDLFGSDLIGECSHVVVDSGGEFVGQGHRLLVVYRHVLGEPGVDGGEHGFGCRRRGVVRHDDRDHGGDGSQRCADSGDEPPGAVHLGG
jgi:hypothetical protein